MENRRIGGQVKRKIWVPWAVGISFPYTRSTRLIGHLRKLDSPEGLHGLQLLSIRWRFQRLTLLVETTQTLGLQQRKGDDKPYAFSTRGSGSLAPRRLS